MRVLLLHPEDSPRRGPWSRQHWDLIADTGKSSPFSEQAWAKQYGCRVLRADSFRQGIADAKKVREIFSTARGRLIDEEGIDWWDLTSLLIAPEAYSLLALQGLASEIGPADDIWATRRGESIRLFETLLGRQVSCFGDSGLSQMAARTMHYAGLVHRFSVAQLKEIFLDKYDSGYQWRSRFAALQRKFDQPVVLLPSAYGNVSRMAAAYAGLLPQQSFLMVATRQSAKQFAPPANVQVRDLAAYARSEFSETEARSLVQRWTRLRSEIRAVAELRVLIEAGVLDSISAWMLDGLRARNAWRTVLERETVAGVLCGDDSNLYTRLPVLLATRRKIPTVDFHHGALDGRYALKDLSCDLYLAKNEMEQDYLLRICGLPAEKVVVGSPPSNANTGAGPDKRVDGGAVLVFSEPYEVGGTRAEEVYRELLPPLCHLARENGRSLTVKLHPFESLAQRTRIIRKILAPEDYEMVRLIDGPLTPEHLDHAWFGITIESTTVIDCLKNGVRCFLCRWLSLGPYEYGRQYARFGVGEVLDQAAQVAEIPKRLETLDGPIALQFDLSQTCDPSMLRRWLTAACEPLSTKTTS